MKIFTLAGLSILLISLSSTAQTPKQSPVKPILILQSPESSSCPISMRVRHGRGDGLIQVGDGKRADVPGSRLRLDLAAAGHASAITQATVTVHGLNGKVSAVPLVPARDQSAEVSRTITVSFAADVDDSFFSEIVLPGFVSPRLVELQSVTYADGSSWKLTGHEGCRAAPDPLVLIAGQ